MDNTLRVDRPTVTLRELALDKMRDAIFDRRFAPGDRLVERKLCDLLGVSRTVVREVVRHLEAEGLVETLAHHGPIVSRVDADRVEQIYEMRMVIEAVAVRACAERIDKKGLNALERRLAGIRKAFAAGNLRSVLQETTGFYEVVFSTAGKTVAWDMFRNLNARINHLRSYTLSSADRSRTGPQEMQAILEAIRSGDADAAERACRLHVENAKTIALQQMQGMG